MGCSPRRRLERVEDVKKAVEKETVGAEGRGW